MGIILNSMYYNEPTTSTAYNLRTWQAMYVVFYQVHKSTIIVFVHTHHLQRSIATLQLTIAGCS